MSADPTSLKEVIKREYVKCAKSPSYFMIKYCMIQHPTKGKVPFQLYPFQQDTLEQFAIHDRLVILKSRQLGISTLIAGYALWLILFHSDKNCLVVAIDQNTSKNLVTKVRVMYDNIPSWLRIKATESNKLSIRLTNGSQIKAVASTGTSGRSEALSLVIVDEAAFVEGAEELWASLQQTLSTGGQGIILSCVTKDTMVFTTEGIAEVAEFVDSQQTGGYKIDQYHIYGKGGLRTGNLFKNNGEVDTKKVHTKYSQLEGSYNHKLWACKRGVYDWYKLEQLEVGDHVATYSGQEVWGSNDDLSTFTPSTSNKTKRPYQFTSITPTLAYLFGLYISEGSAYKIYGKQGHLVGGSITITCGDDLSSTFEQLGLPFYLDSDRLRYTVSAKNLIELFEHVGFDLSLKAHQKRIPNRLLKMSRANIVQLLRGIFDGDGYAYQKGAVNRVGLTTSSQQLASQIRVILTNFGILSELVVRAVDQLNQYDGFSYKFNHPSYRLEINDRNAALFASKVSFNLSRKAFVANRITKSLRANSKDTVPHSIRLYQQIQQATQLTSKEISDIVGYSVNPYLNRRTSYKTDNISKQRVLVAYEAFRDHLDQDYWDRIVDAHISWTAITSIEQGHAETFDFSLPHDPNDFWCHSIIYNSILGHQTPNGVGNFFHKTWIKAENNEFDKPYKTIRLPWTVHPERDIEWRKRQDQELGIRLAAQECDCSFSTSGNTVVAPEIITHYVKTYEKEPIEKTGFDGNMWVWERPDYSKNYIVSADVARGDATDYSAFHVIEVESAAQVASYKGQPTTRDFGNMLVAVATQYADAMLSIENANIGWATIQQVIERGYRNLYYTQRDDALDSDRYLMRGHDLSSRAGLVAGFTMSHKIRPLAISRLELYMRENSCIIRDKRLLDELYTFIYRNGRPEAASGYNDDMVMSFAQGLWVRDTALKLRQAGIELNRAAVQGIRSTVGAYRPTMDSNPWQMHTPSGQNEDLNWLL